MALCWRQHMAGYKVAKPAGSITHISHHMLTFSRHWRIGDRENLLFKAYFKRKKYGLLKIYYGKQKYAK